MDSERVTVYTEKFMIIGDVAIIRIPCRYEERYHRGRNIDTK